MLVGVANCDDCVAKNILSLAHTLNAMNQYRAKRGEDSSENKEQRVAVKSVDHQCGNCRADNLGKSVSDIDHPHILATGTGRRQYLCNQRYVNTQVGTKADAEHSSSQFYRGPCLEECQDQESKHEYETCTHDKHLALLESIREDAADDRGNEQGACQDNLKGRDALSGLLVMYSILQKVQEIA